jgi:hypothetical protein
VTRRLAGYRLEAYAALGWKPIYIASIIFSDSELDLAEAE